MLVGRRFFWLDPWHRPGQTQDGDDDILSKISVDQLFENAINREEQVFQVVSKSLQGHVKVVKIDTEKYPRIASRYNIQALPTLVVFRNGKPIDRIEGYLSGQQLVARLAYVLSKQPSS